MNLKTTRLTIRAAAMSAGLVILLSLGCAPNVTLEDLLSAGGTDAADSAASQNGASSDDDEAVAPETYARLGVLPEIFVAAVDAPAWQRMIAIYVCDGATDEADINIAISQIASVGGGVVELSSGTFYINSHVDISASNLTLRGQGPSTVLVKVGTDTYSVVNEIGPYHDIVVENLQIDGRNVGHPQQSGNKGVFINGDWNNYANCHNITIQGVTVHNATAEAICIDYAQECTIQNCYSHDNAWAGATVAQVKGARIVNNECVNCGTGLPSSSLGAGINAQASENVLIEGNRIRNCQRRGIGVSWHNTLTNWPARNITVRDNFLDNNAFEGIRVWCESNDRTLTGVKVLGNVVTGGAGGNIGVYMSNVDGFEVLENTLDGPGPYGIYSTATATDGLVRNNFLGTRYTVPILCMSTSVDAVRMASMTFLDVAPSDPRYVVADASCAGSSTIVFPVERQPNCPRQLSWAFPTHANMTGFSLAITGVNSLGQSVTETFTDANGWSGVTAADFDSITQIRLVRTGGSGTGDVLDVGITDLLGLGLRLGSGADVVDVVRNGQHVTGFSLGADRTSLSIGAIDAPDDITVYYREPMNYSL